MSRVRLARTWPNLGVVPEVQGGGSHSLLHQLLLRLLGETCSNPGGGRRGFIRSHLPGEKSYYYAHANFFQPVTLFITQVHYSTQLP
jgi:hypothetical protein